MKKLFKLFLIGLFMIPFAVLADTSYKPGDLTNYVTNDDEYEALKDENYEVGRHVVYMGEATDKDYVRALLIAPMMNASYAYDNVDYKTTDAFKNVRSMIEAAGITMTEPYIKPLTDPENYSFITLQELKNIFGAIIIENHGGNAPADGFIPVETIGDGLAELAEIIYNETARIKKNEPTAKIVNGFYTGSFTPDGKYAYVVEFTYEDDGKLKEILIKPDSVESDNLFYVVPVMEFGKDYDCHHKDEPEYACYKCGENDWIWTQIGTQGPTCELEKKILTKDDCVPNIKTGIADYALEVIGLVAVGTCLMVILKKKDFFIGA